MYAALYDRFRYPHRLPRRQLPGGATQELVRFALPLVVATVIQSLSGFADTASVQMCLGLCGTAQLQQIFAVPLSLTKVAEKMWLLMCTVCILPCRILPIWCRP